MQRRRSRKTNYDKIAEAMQKIDEDEQNAFFMTDAQIIVNQAAVDLIPGLERYTIQ